MSEPTVAKIPTDPDRLLCLALDIGEAMLRCGGEIRRVEDTVERICRAYGAVHVEIFAIISMLNGTIRMPDGSGSTQLRRVYGSDNNLFLLEQYNSISRKICGQTPSLDEVDELIRSTKHQKPFPDWICIPGSALAAGGFAVFFGGSWREGLVAGAIGLLMSLISRWELKRINAMAKTLINAFLAGMLACLSVLFGLAGDAGMIMIGTIMLQIPGVSFGTALRDLLCGDVLAGTLKTVQAILSTLMIAFGYLLAMVTMMGVM